MKKTFYFGVILLILFEILNVYFIMPMPGSQEMNSIEIAYFLYSWRWVFRIVFGLMVVVGFLKLWNSPRKIVRVLTLLPLVAVAYLFNFVMVADKMFLQAENLVFKSAAENDLVPLDQIIIGIEFNGEAKAYPSRISCIPSSGERYYWWQRSDGYLLQCLQNRSCVRTNR
jgi:hypothetical protein